MSDKVKNKVLKDLVIRAQAGNLEAYGEIVLRFQDMAVGYAGSILQDFDLARDAAQEAFIQAYRSLRELREPKAFPGWFRRVLFKYCDRIIRTRPPEMIPLEEAWGVSSETSAAVTPMQDDDLHGRVMEAVCALPEKEREVTTLHYINGYSQKDISDFLEVPITTVKSRLHSARNRLRERITGMVRREIKGRRPGEEFREAVLREISRVRVRLSDEHRNTTIHRIFLVDTQKRPLAIYIDLGEAIALNRFLAGESSPKDRDVYTAFVKGMTGLGFSIRSVKLVIRPFDQVGTLLEFESDGSRFECSCGAGDGINVAMRSGAPIFADPEFCDAFVLRRRDGKPLSPAAAWRRIRQGHHFPQFRDISEVIRALEKEPQSERARRALFDATREEVQCVPPVVGKTRGALSQLEAWAEKVGRTELEGIALGLVGAAFLLPLQTPYSQPGDPEKTLRYLEAAHEKRPGDAMIAFDLSSAYTLVGRKDEALALIEKFRFPEAAWDQNFEPLWKEARFQAAVGPPREGARGWQYSAQFRMGLYRETTPERVAESLAKKAPPRKMRKLRRSRIREIEENVGVGPLIPVKSVRRTRGGRRPGGRLILEVDGMPLVKIHLTEQDVQPVDAVFYDRKPAFHKAVSEIWTKLDVAFEAGVLLKRTRRGIEGAIILQKGMEKTMTPIKGPAVLALVLQTGSPLLIDKKLAERFSRRTRKAEATTR